MEQLDWQIFLFVGTSLVHDTWINWGFPKIYYWECKKENLKTINSKNNGEHL